MLNNMYDLQITLNCWLSMFEDYRDAQIKEKGFWFGLIIFTTLTFQEHK